MHHITVKVLDFSVILDGKMAFQAFTLHEILLIQCYVLSSMHTLYVLSPSFPW